MASEVFRCGLRRLEPTFICSSISASTVQVSKLRTPEISRDVTNDRKLFMRQPTKTNMISYTTGELVLILVAIANRDCYGD